MFSLIPSKENSAWHYLAAKKISALLHKKTSSHNDDFYCLHCFYSFSMENKLKSQGEVCKNKDFCRVEMPLEKNNILKFNL